MDVTVVVPMHNAQAAIGRCLDSIAAQTSAPARVLVVDDGSTDGSAEVRREHHLAGLEVVTSHVSRGPGAAQRWLAPCDG